MKRIFVLLALLLAIGSVVMGQRKQNAMIHAPGTGDVVFNVKAYGALCNRVGTTGTNDRVAVQAAITAAEAAGGGTVVIPGQCLVGTTTASSYVLTITKSIKLVGVGGAESGLYMTTDTPTTTSLLRFAPTALPYNEGFTIEDITLGVAGNTNPSNWTCSPCSGKHLIVLDVSGAPSAAAIHDFTMNRTRLLPTSTSAGTVAITTTGTNFNGTPGKSRITNSLIYNGISFPASGDSILIQSVRLVGKNGIDISPVSGATEIHLNDLNYTLEGGITITGDIKGFVLENSILESVAGTVGSNGAFLDLNATVVTATIRNNVFNSHNSPGINGIRINSSGTGVVVVDGNTGSVGATKNLLDLTLAAPNLTILWNLNSNGGAGGLWTPANSSQLRFAGQFFPVMPTTGNGNLGNLALLGDGRFVGAVGRAPTVNVDNLDTALYSQYRFENSGTLFGGINAIGAAYATTTRRNNLEIFNFGTGDIVFNTSGSFTERWRIVTAGHLAAQSQGMHVNQSAANSDIAGAITLTAATSGSKTFTTAFTSAPVCVVTPQFDIGAGVSFWVTTSTTAVTANTSGAVTGSFSYTCFGNPN